MRKAFISVVFLALMMSGCTTTQKGAAVGGAAGSVVGGVIGHQSGHGVTGAVIGAGAGAVAGGLIGEQMDTKFCPVCGTHYASDVTYCPKDGSELKDIQK